MVYEKIVSNSEYSLIFTLRGVLQNNIVTVGDMYELLGELRLYLLKYGIAVSDLSMNNLILKLDVEARLYLVDGVGGRNFDLKYRIRKRFSFYARYKMKQQWPKLLDEIKSELSSFL